MRISHLFPSLFLGLALATPAFAQDPGAQQDAQAAREKLLKAADALDNIQANSESTKTAVDAMKADITKLQGDISKLQTDNTAMQQQLDTLRTALKESEASRAKERQVLLDKVAELVAAGKTSTPAKSTSKKKDSSEKKDTSASTDQPDSAPEDKPVHAKPDQPVKPSTTAPEDSTSANLAPPPDPGTPATVPVKTQKGYYHIVAEGETLTMICTAYRQEGVKVTVGQVMRANGLTDKSVLKVGQKLFIPKPGGT